jgi:hypothetical protein
VHLVGTDFFPVGTAIVVMRFDRFDLLSCGQPSMGSFDGVLHTLPSSHPGLSSAPIQAWPGLMPVERSFAMTAVLDDSSVIWFRYGASVFPLLR